MKPFTLDSSMTTMAGVFYPTGHMFVMFPTRADAEQASEALVQAGVESDEISLVTPEMIHGQIARTVGSSDIPLPSAGTEGDTVRRFAELASQGHHALLVHAPKAQDSDQAMEALKPFPISYAQKYRQLVIQDLV
ncbi:MAG: RNA-binding protein [Haliea sp.]|nr:MAG: RNA-binding protein [Haliea sp.]